MNTSPVQTCKRCLYNTSHPLGLVLDEEGICSGCRVHEEKDSLDWAERWQRLEHLVKPYRSRDSRNYDCIVPVTGAGDSFFIVHVVKERLGLKPLLVTYNRYYNTPLGIRNLAQLRRRFDCDLLIQSVNPLSVKKIIRTTLRELGSFHWPVLAGQSVFPVHTAVSHQIPLIIWGAHQGVEQVGMFSHLHEVEMNRRYRKDHDLMGYEAEDLISIFDTLNEQDVCQYAYPEESSIESCGMRGIYLNNYVRWDPWEQHILMSRIAGYESASSNRTFDVFDHIDDWHYLGAHDYLKGIRCGLTKVVDQLCREIRHFRISRDQALRIASYYHQQPPMYINLLLDMLNIDERSFYYTINTCNRRSSSDATPVHDGHEVALEDMPDGLRMPPTSSMSRHMRSNHVIIGKGYP